MNYITEDFRDFTVQLSSSFKNELKIVHMNAQSLNDSKHFSEFCHIFVESGIDIIAVSETFYNANSKVKLPGYKVFNINGNNRRGGYVAVYLAEWMDGRVLATSTGGSFYPEYVILEVKTNKCMMLFCCIYRPPKIGHLDVFADDLEKFMISYKYTVVCGDINARLGSGADETTIIENILYNHNLTILPLEATYHTSHCDTKLDIIASNCNDLIVDFGQRPAPGFSSNDLIG